MSTDRFSRRRRQKITSYRLPYERLVAFILSIRRVGRGLLGEEPNETSARPRACGSMLFTPRYHRPPAGAPPTWRGQDDVCLDVRLI